MDGHAIEQQQTTNVYSVGCEGIHQGNAMQRNHLDPPLHFTVPFLPFPAGMKPSPSIDISHDQLVGYRQNAESSSRSGEDEVFEVEDFVWTMDLYVPLPSKGWLHCRFSSES